MNTPYLRRNILITTATCVLIILFYGPTDNWVWDPSYYYTQLRAPVINHSLDLRAGTQPPNTYRTARGLQPSQWPIGPGILWSPFFIATDLLVRWFGTLPLANGISWPYIAAVSAGSALYGLLGVLIIYRTCRVFTSRGPASIAALLALCASPLFYYTFRQPIMAHSTSIFAMALLMYVCVAYDQGTIVLRHSGLLIGAMLGLNMILRWIGLSALLLPLALYAVYVTDAWRVHNTPRLRQLALQALIASVTVLAIVTPQLAFWHGVYGSWLIIPIQGFSRSALPEHLLDLFVHTNRGILWWAPAILIGMLGLYRVQPPRLRIAILVYLAGYLYVLGTWQVWYGGGGYGPRFFIETLPCTALGCALLLQRFWAARTTRLVAYTATAVLVLHQWMLMVIVERTWLPFEAYFTGKPLGFAYQFQGATRLLSQPLELFRARPGIVANRQAAIANILNGQSSWHFYALPLVAIGIIVIGLGLFNRVAKRSRIVPATALLTSFMLGWFFFLFTLSPL